MSVSHPVFARLYQRVAPAMESGGLAELREELLAGLWGRVIEVGAGGGANFPHYPERVEHVVAVEPEPYLRAAAVRATGRAAVPVEIVEGLADALPAPDASFDAAVVSLVLCSVPDQERALAELWRVLRPGGELRFLEHVRSTRPVLAGVQRAVDLVWPWLGGGCHTARATLGEIRWAGFEVSRVRAFRFPEGGLSLPTSPHVLGTARRPDGA
ncbi:MAG TPA: class I SAM-dependent methyltransferase [Nitriliruptorales bacterium]|nr:class I SAM-dependent methyltransferase [Nitriliruptorales bacterium]